MNMTLDGFMAGPNGELDWHFPFWSEEMSRYACDQLRMMDTILIGRVTYESMASYWSSAPDDCFADMMYNYSKIVFSRSLKNAVWNNSRVVHDHIHEEVCNLKQQPGQDMIIYGSGTLVSSLTAMDLIDEYRIWVHPIVIGKGRRFFNEINHIRELLLLKTKFFDSGVIVLYYQLDNFRETIDSARFRVYENNFKHPEH
jgi:dihydrofolate reductase